MITTRLTRTLLKPELGQGVLRAIDSEEDPTVPLMQMLLMAFTSNSSRMSLLGLYDKAAPGRLIEGSFAWLKNRDIRALTGIREDIELWMRCCLVHDRGLQGNYLQVVEGALEDRSAEALSLACAVKKPTAQRWLRGSSPGPKSRGCLYTFSSNLLDGKHIYLRHLPKADFISWWFEPLDILSGYCPAEAHSTPGVRRMNVERAMRKVWDESKQ